MRVAFIGMSTFRSTCTCAYLNQVHAALRITHMYKRAREHCSSLWWASPWKWPWVAARQGYYTRNIYMTDPVRAGGTIDLRFDAWTRVPPGELTPNYRADNNPGARGSGWGWRGREERVEVRVGWFEVAVCSRCKSECPIARGVCHALVSRNPCALSRARVPRCAVVAVGIGLTSSRVDCIFIGARSSILETRTVEIRKVFAICEKQIS